MSGGANSRMHVGAAVVTPAQRRVFDKMDRTVPGPSKRKPDPQPLPSKAEARRAWDEAGGDPASFERWWRGGDA